MNYWHPSSTRVTAPQGTSAAVYYPQYPHLHGNGSNNALQGSYTPMSTLVPLPTDPPAGFVASSLPAASQPMLHLTELAYRQGATSPPIYQAPGPSGSVPNHPLFNRPPGVLDSLQIPLLALPPTTTPVLSHPEVEGQPQPATTKRKRKTAASTSTAKRRKKAADTLATPVAAPCGVGPSNPPTTAPDTTEDFPQLLHAYTDPTMSSRGRGSSARKNAATDVWHFLMTIPSVEKPDVLPDVTRIPTLTVNPGVNCNAVACRLCV